MAEYIRIASTSRHSPICPKTNSIWFLSQSQEMHLKAGEILFAAGQPGGRHVRAPRGTVSDPWRTWTVRRVVIPLKAGDVTGVLPFSRMKQFTVSGRAMTDAAYLRFPAAQFPELVQKMPELTQRLVG